MSRVGLPGGPGWPAVEALLGDLDGLDLLDLGCRDGALARLAVQRGAASVLALDLDADRLDGARAREEAAGAGQPRIHYEQADLEQATLPFEAYDVAHCALLLDRLDDPLRFARMVRAGLRQHARLVVSLRGDDPRPVDALRTADLDVRQVEPWSPTADVAGLLVLATKPPRRSP